MMAGFLFDGHVRNISNIDYSIYATFTISAGLELPADLLSIPAIDHVGRKVWLLSSVSRLRDPASLQTVDGRRFHPTFESNFW